MAENDKKQKKRGKNFTETEEIQLVRAYLSVSQDPITGTGQKGQAFWERITENFNNSNEAGIVRPISSLESKWAVISHDVSKFVGHFAMLRILCNLARPKKIW